jgi:uncharacterized protein YbjT (DUF2867 family)
MKTALVAGSTGLIGNQLLKILLESNRYDVVKAITRHDLAITHAKLVQLKIDFANLSEYKDLQADDVFCCLGTTMAKAKSKEKFQLVDLTYPVELAKAAQALGSKQYLLVSALGADKKSSIYYNRIKGEVEAEIQKFKFESIHIFRPSLLLGSRSESRPGEDAAKIFYKFFGFLLPGKYKAVDAEKVARAMLHFASKEERGIFIHESMELQNF